jgi:muramoyltetrapeptide carboxypeptidase
VTDAIVRPGAAILEEWGFRVSLDDRIYHRTDDGYLAGEDHHRAAALNDALRDDDVDAIVFSRGGYGAMRILDAIDWPALRRNPRPLCGFSDITALHLAALRHAGVATLHGPVVKSFESQASALESLRATLTAAPTDAVFPVEAVRSGNVAGPAIGGNLSLLVAMLGSEHLPSLDGAVLFLEDVGESDYRLDRLFTALRLSTAARHVAAVVLGDFVDCHGTYVDESRADDFVRRLGRELGETLDAPVVSGFPFGHGERNRPFWQGLRVAVDTDAGTVTFEND